jgi:hypothetical protein
MAEFNEVPYDEYLKSRARADKPDTALFAYRERFLFTAPRFNSLTDAIDAYYDNFFRLFGDDEKVMSGLEKVSPEQLHYYMTETQDLATFIGSSGMLTQVISKSNYHLKFGQAVTAKIKEAFPTIPDMLTWRRSLNAPGTQIKSSELLGTRLKGWRTA